MTMAPTSSAGSLLQTIFALVFVLALLIGLAWFMKRYGPKVMGGNNKMRVVSSLNLGGRERIVLVEVADQWIVVGASPGRINALARCRARKASCRNWQRRKTALRPPIFPSG